MHSLENFRVIVFRVVAEQLSFTQAATVLRLSQPAITGHIKALEADLGVRLFDRSSGRVQLTTEGEALCAYAKESARLSEEALRAIGDRKGKTYGRLALGASTTIAQYVLPGVLAEFASYYPDARITVVSGNTAEIVERLLSANIELGLIEGPPGTSDVKTETFLADEIVAIMPSGGAYNCATDELDLQALARQRLLMREPGSGSRNVVENSLRAAGLSTRDLNIVMELDSTEAIKSAVEAGLGIGFASTWALRNDSRQLRVTRICGLRITRDFQFVYPQGPEPNGIAGHFLSAARTFRARVVQPDGSHKQSKC